MLAPAQDSSFGWAPVRPCFITSQRDLRACGNHARQIISGSEDRVVCLRRSHAAFGEKQVPVVSWALLGRGRESDPVIHKAVSHAYIKSRSGPNLSAQVTANKAVTYKHKVINRLQEKLS